MPTKTKRLYVLDACALVAFLYDEDGAEVVQELLDHDENRCLIHAINACEVYYDLLRRGNDKDAASLEGVLEDTGVQLNSDLSIELWKAAGKLKAEWRRVSLADCFALALTIDQQASLVTSDHHELDSIAEAGVCSVRFIR